LEQQKKEEKERETLREKRKRTMNMDRREGGNVFGRLLRGGAGEAVARPPAAKGDSIFYNLPEGNAQMLMEVENCIFTVSE
jgi:hypothetical protein